MKMIYVSGAHEATDAAEADSASSLYNENVSLHVPQQAAQLTNTGCSRSHSDMLGRLSSPYTDRLSTTAGPSPCTDQLSSPLAGRLSSPYMGQPSSPCTGRPSWAGHRRSKKQGPAIVSRHGPAKSPTPAGYRSPHAPAIFSSPRTSIVSPHRPAIVSPHRTSIVSPHGPAIVAPHGPAIVALHGPAIVSRLGASNCCPSIVGQAGGRLRGQRPALAWPGGGRLVGAVRSSLARQVGYLRHGRPTWTATGGRGLRPPQPTPCGWT